MVASIELGSLADWIAALGTVGALIASLVVLRYEINVRRADSRERIEEERRSQARRISCWPLEVKARRDVDEMGRSLQGMGGNSSVRVALRNASAEPAYDVVVHVRHTYEKSAGAMGSFPFLLPPDTTREVWVDGVDLPGGGLAGLPYVELVFRDVKGRRWLRAHSGRLLEMDDERQWVELVRELPDELDAMR